ncbi:MAG: molybdopterin-dependent oxidoreductase [Spirochaetales bacterium]|nr:molybdopterin-dependent oxidoreductase [Spirochaetales bacterium]
MRVRIKVNGTDRFPVESELRLPLMIYLRESLGLKSVKNGCGEGHCGACTIILDGKAVFSCRKSTGDLDQSEIVTLEALSNEEAVHPLIYSFCAEGAVQCGFCTPGFIMSAKALLDRNPDPSGEEIKQALKGNICRCTGYVKILKAVKLAAKLLREGQGWISRKEILSDTQVLIGDSVIRPDSIDKSTGTAVYADDLDFPEMLFTKVARSMYLHAEIININIDKALKTPGVVKVLTWKDIPGENSFGPIKKDQPVLADRLVRYKGDAIAAVYAESEEAAVRGMEAVEVEYKELPHIIGLEQVLSSDCPEIHEGSGNIIAKMESGRGDISKGFNDSDFILEKELKTQYVEHAYLEPESCLARMDEDGILIVHVASQGPPMDAHEIAPVLGIPADRIRISGTVMGGGFGGKEDISVQIIASLGAYLTGRPVKYTFTRRESIAVSGKRNSVIMNYKMGFTADGRITAVKADLSALGGAYASVEEAVILRSSSFAAGPYTIPAGEVKALAYYQNHPPACAMRGFGNPTVTFGSETMLNMAASELGIDPLELRLKNALVPGMPTITGDRPLTSVGIKDCLQAVKDSLAEYKYPEPKEGWIIGTGVAASYKNVGLGIGMDDSAGADGEILSDGTLILKVGCVDMGQGAGSAMAQILSHRLGWPFNRIKVFSADTFRDPLAGMTTASRQTFISGNAVLELAGELERKIRQFLSESLNLDGDQAVIRNNNIVSQKDNKTLLSLDTFLKRLENTHTSLKAHTHFKAPQTSFALKEPPEGWKDPVSGRLHAAYCYAAQATILEVNPDNGKVNVLDVIIASDAGRVINRAAIEGQMEGGVVMGLGYALSEAFIQEGDRTVTDTYGKLGIWRIGKVPNIKTIVVENPHDDGPEGAKGMGELPLSMGAPSVVHAIHDALGIWVTSLPVTPDKIKSML